MKRELYLGENISKIPGSTTELTQHFTRALVANKVIHRDSNMIRHSLITVSDDGFLEEGDINIWPLALEKEAIKSKGDMYYLDTTLLCGVIIRNIALPRESEDRKFLRVKAIRDAVDEKNKTSLFKV